MINVHNKTKEKLNTSRPEQEDEDLEERDDSNFFEEEDEEEYERKTNNGSKLPMPIIIVGSVIIVLVIFLVIASLFSKKSSTTSEVSTTNTTDESSVVSNTATDTTVSESDSVYDENGNVVNEDAIDPGLPDFEGNDVTQTTPKVYSSSDFIKDLNGIDIPAVYNVEEMNYKRIMVNYEKKRAIIADGFELYWLDVTYDEKPYRVQVPMYIFTELDDKGICLVEAEVLSIEGGGKIISYMQVIPNFDDILNGDAE